MKLPHCVRGILVFTEQCCAAKSWKHLLKFEKPSSLYGHQAFSSLSWRQKQLCVHACMHRRSSMSSWRLAKSRASSGKGHAQYLTRAKQLQGPNTLCFNIHINQKCYKYKRCTPNRDKLSATPMQSLTPDKPHSQSHYHLFYLMLVGNEE